MHAILLARAGDPERALELVWLACRLDLDDLTGTSAGGLHVATMGGVWQALTTGFLGLRPSGDALGLDPRLPEAWDAVELRLRHRGRRLGVRAGHDQLKLATDGPVPVRLPGLPARTVTAPGASWQRAGQEWKEKPRPNLGPRRRDRGRPTRRRRDGRPMRRRAGHERLGWEACALPALEEATNHDRDAVPFDQPRPPARDRW